METSSGNDGRRNDGVHQAKHPVASSAGYASPSESDAPGRIATTALIITTIKIAIFRNNKKRGPGLVPGPLFTYYLFLVFKGDLFEIFIFIHR